MKLDVRYFIWCRIDVLEENLILSFSLYYILLLYSIPKGFVVNSSVNEVSSWTFLLKKLHFVR